MKRIFCATVVACMVLLGPAMDTLALPPHPVRDGARSDYSCQNRHGASGQYTHGSYVSGVAQALYPAPPALPTDPFEPCGILTDS